MTSARAAIVSETVGSVARYLARLSGGEADHALGPELHVRGDARHRLDLLVGRLFVVPEQSAASMRRSSGMRFHSLDGGNSVKILHLIEILSAYTRKLHEALVDPRLLIRSMPCRDRLLHAALLRDVRVQRSRSSCPRSSCCRPRHFTSWIWAASTFASGLFLGFLTYSSAFSAPVTGALADRVGQRRVLITPASR